MATGRAEVTVAKAPDEVWGLVGGFGGLDAWMPGIESCTVEGDLRTLSLTGMEIVEQLRGRDEAARRITYGIVKAPVPVEHHEATITVTPEGDGSRVTWDVEVRPDELLGIFVSTYEGALQAVKERLGS
jgi:carbon monoxide dehydrogenase subunit G